MTSCIEVQNNKVRGRKKRNVGVRNVEKKKKQEQKQASARTAVNKLNPPLVEWWKQSNRKSELLQINVTCKVTPARANKYCVQSCEQKENFSVTQQTNPNSMRNLVHVLYKDLTTMVKKLAPINILGSGSGYSMDANTLHATAIGALKMVMKAKKKMQVMLKKALVILSD